MDQGRLAEWDLLVDDAIKEAERRMASEEEHSKKRAVQLAREQGYHRLAVEIDRPGRSPVGAGQLSFFPSDPTLFDGP
ncbi:MAG: hypothetical protein H0U53_03200 [Actinobacteria bacterium]|nr:hypothetical protein [Actinomycetota bacterium]